MLYTITSFMKNKYRIVIGNNCWIMWILFCLFFHIQETLWCSEVLCSGGDLHAFYGQWLGSWIHSVTAAGTRLYVISLPKEWHRKHPFVDRGDQRPFVHKFYSFLLFLPVIVMDTSDLIGQELRHFPCKLHPRETWPLKFLKQKGLTFLQPSGKN